MARLHTKKHGKSGSHKPATKMPPAWVNYSKEDIAGLVEKLAKEGKTAALIGQQLRDEYGIPSVRVMAQKKIAAILKEKGLAGQYPQDMVDLFKRAVGMRKHLKANSRDSSNKIKLTHVEAKIKRLGKYYSREGVIPAKWKYDAEKTALLVK